MPISNRRELCPTPDPSLTFRTMTQTEHTRNSSARDDAIQRVAFQNVGCKLNQYETEALQHRFGSSGFDIVPFGEVADIYVVNTCTVTGAGDADSRKAVRRARRLAPGATVVATGCYAQRRPVELREAGADLVVGNGDKAGLFEAVETARRGDGEAEFVPGRRPRTQEFLQIDGLVPRGRTRGTLQIQDGCDEHCTYCIIPMVRGEGVSRPAEEVVDQARRMVAAGYRELALTGVHSGSYAGADGNETLVDLLRRLDDVDGLVRIRLNSIEPGWVSDAIIEHGARSTKFCRHFHIPLQSGDDEILRRMGRRYSRDYYAERIDKIARLIPDCAIGADVMVGFPGESESHFANTAALIKELPLTYLHVFSYSSRPGTPAERMKSHHPRTLKSDRARRLITIGEEKRLAFHRRFVERTVEVLVEEGIAPSGLARGMSDNYTKVLFEPRPETAVAANDFVEVRITSAREDLIFGEEVAVA